MITRGIQPRVVMEVLGHSQISTTMDTYAHVFADVQREAVNELDKLLEEPKTDTDSNPIKDDPELSSQDDTNP
jgi:integrase